MKSTITRLLVAAMLLIGLLGATAAPVYAAGQTEGTGCGAADTYFIAYENKVGDTSDGDDWLRICSQIQSDTLTIDHDPSGICKPQILHNDWTSCLSSFRVYIRDSTRKLCVYQNFNYTGFLEDFNYTDSTFRIDLLSSDNDKAKSFKWQYRGTACNA